MAKQAKEESKVNIIPLASFQPVAIAKYGLSKADVAIDKAHLNRLGMVKFSYVQKRKAITVSAKYAKYLVETARLAKYEEQEAPVAAAEE